MGLKEVVRMMELMLLFRYALLPFALIGPRKVAATIVWPEANPTYQLLGQATCQGDELYRPVPALCASVPHSNASQAAAECFALCDRLVKGMSRCMGVEVNEDGLCCLVDRDWTRSERSQASVVLGGAPLDISQMFERYGSHLVRAEDDDRRLAFMTVGTACYRRRVDCSAAPNCTALHRYPCEWGKIPNSCDRCRPRYWTPGQAPAAGNGACVRDPAATPPTLRIAFSTATLQNDKLDTQEGLQAGYVGLAFVVKRAWETASKVIPLALEDRENFTVEFVGFTENWTKVVTVTGGGTNEASEESIVPGILAMGGSADTPVQTSLQLRQTSPPGQPVHAVIGNLKSIDSEKLIANAGTAYQTPVLGFNWNEPTLATYPYYVRTNRVSLDAGLATAAVFQKLGYTLIFVYEQVKVPQLASQIRTASPLATVVTDGPDQSVRGPCDGKQVGCIREGIKAWARLRAQDARIIAHEHGGAIFENLLPMATDILGSKVLYVAVGLECSNMFVMTALATAQQGSAGLDTFYDVAKWQGPRCQICMNIAWEFLDFNVLQNKTYVAEWLYNESNVDIQPEHVRRCPHLPNIKSFLACDYCNVAMPFFASPECWQLSSQYDKTYFRSMCVEADLSFNIALGEAVTNLILTVGDEKPSGNDTKDGLRAAQRMMDEGMPASYLETYLPGGRLWNLGMQSLGRPVTWSAHWEDLELMVGLAKDLLGNFNIDLKFFDVILTLLLGYNDFVKRGGDADDASKVGRPFAENSVSYGFLRSLLGVRFTGLTGPVEYRLSGSRNVFYKVYQAVKSDMLGCYANIQVRNGTGGSPDFVYKIPVVTALWNFVTVPAELNMSAPVALDDSNLLGCDAFKPGYFAGKIALIRRGVCYIITKALMAQAAGAIAFVMWNHVSDLERFMWLDDPTLRIPGISLGRSIGESLAQAVRSGAPVTLTLPGSTRCLDPQRAITGGVKMYELSMIFNPNAKSLVVPAGNLTFNDGTTTPPLQVRPQCATGAAYNLSSRDCESCKPGAYLPSTSAPSCLPCAAGSFSGTYGGTSCQLCGLGEFSNASSPSCTPCAIGKVAPLLGAPSCAPCEAGRYWSSGTCRGCAPGNFQKNEASTACELCPPGFFVEEAEKSACNSCMPGSYQQAFGTTSCVLCNVTSYQPKRSSVDCAPCGAVIAGSLAPGLGTFDLRMCQCLEGLFLFRPEPNASGRCLPCPDGLTCPGGLTSEGECCEPPTQNARLHVGKPAFQGGPFPFIIYCSDAVKCPAGRALGECPPHAEGRACQYCEEGYSYSRSAGQCITCAGQRTFWPVLLTCLVVVFILLLTILYAAQEFSVESQTMTTIAISLSLAANVLQVLGAFREMRLEWVEPLKTLYSILQVFTFNVELINPACVFGQDSPNITYLGALLVHPVFALVLSLIFVVLRYLPKRYLPKRLRRNMSMPQAVNAQGMVLLSLYISVSIVAVKPWQCERNPDGSSSVVSYRVVECWSRGSLHGTMLGFSAVGVLIYDISFIAVVFWATYVYTIRIRRPGGIDFLRYFRFLFSRFKPECYWYGLVYCIRNMLLALIPVALVNEVSAQFFVTAALVMSTSLVQCWIRPWRTDLPNYVDAASSIALMLILVGGTILMDRDSGSSKIIVQGFFIGTLILVAVVFLWTVLYSLYFFVRPQKPYGIFLSHHKVGAAVLARWFKLHLSTLTKDGIFYDSDNLSRLDELFEVCAYQCKNVVVLLTRETLRRIWCAGEIVSAFQHKVNVVLVACADYQPPSDAFIEDIEYEWSDLQKTEVMRLGIRMDDIRQVYTHLKTRPTINLDRHMRLMQQCQTAEEVFWKCSRLRYTTQGLVSTGTKVDSTASLGASVSDAKTLSTTKTLSSTVVDAPVVLYGEAKEPEDRMVGVVITIMLQQQLGVPVHLVEALEDVYDSKWNNQYFVVLLARGVLESPAAGALVAKAFRRNKVLLPVNFDPGFTFPGEAYYDRLVSGEVYPQSDPCLRGNSLAKVGQAYLKLFSVLSLRFTPHGSEKLQRVEVSEMAPHFSKLVKIGDDEAMQAGESMEVDVEASNVSPTPTKEASAPPALDAATDMADSGAAAPEPLDEEAAVDVIYEADQVDMIDEAAVAWDDIPPKFQTMQADDLVRLY